MPPLEHKKSKGSKKAIEIKDIALAEDAKPEALAESLYKKNIELLTTNKTLSLLSKLYEISILTLDPKNLAARISETVQVDLNFEIVGIFLFEENSNSLTPIAFSKSEKTKKTLTKLSITLEDIKILNVTSQNFFNKVISEGKENVTEHVGDIWGGQIEKAKLQTMASESNIKATIAAPLIVHEKVLGIIMFALNRNYEALNSFEKQSIKSFINVIALALEKAFLYHELESANVQLRQLDKEKDELLSIVSHQLASPVTSIKWYLELMLDGEVGQIPKEQMEYLNSMKSVAADLADLVGMILDASRIQLGRLKIDRQAVDLSEFLQSILDVIDPKAKEKKIHFNKLIPKTSVSVNIDKRLTRMAVENLLSNAIKYTPKDGAVTFKVEVGDRLKIEVRDTGMGIPKDEQSKIFGKLFRASNTSDIGGNGFGLYISKGAIESQDGKIWFESEEGKGTAFFIDMPFDGKVEGKK